MIEQIIGTNRNHPSVACNMGLVSGIVKGNYDEKQPGKVKVEYSLGEQGKMLTGWIPVMTSYVAEKGGNYFLPEIGTQVVIGFLGGRTDCPIVIGSLWSKTVERAATMVTEKNTVKMLRTKGGHEITFSEEENKGIFSLKTPGELTVSFEDEKKIIRVQDKEKKNSVVIDADKGEIAIDAEKKISLSVGGKAAITIQADSLKEESKSIEISAQQSLKAKGQSTAINGSQLEVKADSSMKLKAGASMQVEASGMLQVKGSMLKLN